MKGAFPDALYEDAAAPAAVTYYSHDAFGNRVRTATCGTAVSESDCRMASASGAGGYQFHPANPASAMRYSSAEYDSLGRFVDRTREVYFSSLNSAVELPSSSVVQRNTFGDPTSLVDVNRVEAYVRYGVLGRKRYTYSPNGSSTRWDARYCAGIPSAAGKPTVACPSGLNLAYRSTTTSAGAPTQLMYYDVLGRPVLALVQDFTPGKWNATLTQYDKSGNVASQSEPFGHLE